MVGPLSRGPGSDALRTGPGPDYFFFCELVVVSIVIEYAMSIKKSMSLGSR